MIAGFFVRGEAGAFNEGRPSEGGPVLWDLFGEGIRGMRRRRGERRGWRPIPDFLAEKSITQQLRDTSKKERGRLKLLKMIPLNDSCTKRKGYP